MPFRLPIELLVTLGAANEYRGPVSNSKAKEHIHTRVVSEMVSYAASPLQLNLVDKKIKRSEGVA